MVQDVERKRSLTRLCTHYPTIALVMPSRQCQMVLAPATLRRLNDSNIVIG